MRKINALLREFRALKISLSLKFIIGTAAEINAVNHCEVHFYDLEGKIVVTIEGESINAQIETMRHIQDSPHVLSASLMYSYCKDEITEALKKIGPG